ncbi:MAG: PAS domain-containing sensor histidine kinase [Clostridiales bacterium]|jgi:two-component system phosphate regulon sensor histidine kinase PhoR|nr:PAS domain-containing sensor histidine kinase [Clostridiales bacterium]
MSSKIFKAIWLVAVVIFLASVIFIMGISYDYLTNIQEKQLRIKIELASQGVNLSGMSYFDELNTSDYRITWIASDGTVIYDNEADKSLMENHLEREEAKEALETGYGEAARYSSTLAERQLYAAKKLNDGSILRLSIVQMAVWTLILGFAQPISFVILLALALSFILASRLAKKIVEPINQIDLDNPKQYYDKENYKEVEPLLRKIANQQEQLKRDNSEIEKASLIRQEFTANVSHELKTPLHAISGYAELLEKGMVKEEDVKPFASKIRAESARISSLVEDIIDLTKLDNGGSKMSWEDCDLFKIAENAADSLETAAAVMHIDLSVEGESAPIRGVPQLLYSIVYNLCDNAIKYNKYGGSVSVYIEVSQYEIKLQIKDTGIGIPRSSLDRIFERFYRVDKSRSKEVGGTGLGLSIVKHAVLIHNGTINVESELGKGTVFTITLPKNNRSI